MDARARPRPVRVLLRAAPVLLTVLFLLGPPSFTTAPARSTPGSGIAIVPFSGGNCSNVSTLAAVVGTLGVGPGAGTRPSVANVTVAYAYHVQDQFIAHGRVLSVNCSNDRVSTRTNTTGAFSLVATVPNASCTLRGCHTYSGPFGPGSVGAVGPLPPGFFVPPVGVAARVTLNLTTALARLALVPNGSASISVAAPTTVRANPLAGDGTPSPAALTYSWTLNGTDWTIAPGPDGASVTVTGGMGAAPAVVAVVANGTFNGSPVSAARASVSFTAVATGITTGSVAPTSVDSGVPVEFRLTGSGAPGYRYAMVVTPGLDAAPTSVPCTTGIGPGAVVPVTCALSYNYSAFGSAQPTANLSNGYSVASWNYPTVTIGAGLRVTVTPSPADVYRGSSLDVSVGAVSGTGIAPYGPACLDPGAGPMMCLVARATAFTFSVNYPTVGMYSARADLADSGGANATLDFLVQVATLPSIDPIAADRLALSLGESVGLTSTVHGGALPLAFWWNGSAPFGTVAAGTLASDGPVSLSFAPVATGDQYVTLTVKDALGTEVAQELRLSVVSGPAAGLAVASAGSVPPTAGVPEILSWTAVDPSGLRVPDFASPIQLSVAAPSANDSVAAWLNGSFGSVRWPLPNGSALFLPGDAWRAGYLNLSFETPRAERFVVSGVAVLENGASVAGSTAFTVAPDAAHLRLFGPRTFVDGPQENDTLWHLSDRFGNPAPSGFVIVRMTVAGSIHDAASPIFREVGASVVWVNFSLDLAAPGTVTVLSSDGAQVLLPPIAIPAAPAPTSAIVPAVAAGVGVSGAVGFWAVALRRRGSERPAEPPVQESELRKMAEGRAWVLDSVRARGPVKWSSLEAEAARSGYASEELAEWVRTMLVDGGLTARPGPAGVVEFSAGAAAQHATRLTPELDADALEAALLRRDERANDGDAGRGP